MSWFKRKTREPGKDVTQPEVKAVVANASVDCDISPSDSLKVTMLPATDARTARVVVELQESGNASRVAFSPAKARKFAAAVLNQADGVEGFKSMFDTEGDE